MHSSQATSALHSDVERETEAGGTERGGNDMKKKSANRVREKLRKEEKMKVAKSREEKKSPTDAGECF